MSGRLGKLAPDPTRRALHLAPFLTGAKPDFPPSADWLSLVNEWDMYGNNVYGSCVWAAAGHAVEAWTRYASGVTVTIPEDAILKGYHDVTGWNPDDPSTDQGTVMQDALDYWRRTGIAGHKILAFAKVTHDDLTEIDAAIALFGSVLVGIQFPSTGFDQFDRNQPWDVVAGASIEGGHAIHVGAYKTGGLYQCTTWARVQAMTERFWLRYADEAWVVITPEWLAANGTAPSGLDLAGLGEAFTQLTGDPSPIPPPDPAPPLDPVTPADAAMWSKTHRWANRFHTGIAGNAAAAAAVRDWARVKGLMT